MGCFLMLEALSCLYARTKAEVLRYCVIMLGLCRDVKIQEGYESHQLE